MEGYFFRDISYPFLLQWSTVVYVHMRSLSPTLLKFLPDCDSFQRNLDDIFCYIKCVKEGMSIEHLREWYWQVKAKPLRRNRSHYHCVHPKSNMTLTVIKPGPFKWKQRKPASDIDPSSDFFTMTEQPPVGQGLLIAESSTITLRHTTLGRTLLDEWSARRGDLCLTTNNIYNRHTSTPPTRFEHTIPQASDRRPTL